MTTASDNRAPTSTVVVLAAVLAVVAIAAAVIGAAAGSTVWGIVAAATAVMLAGLVVWLNQSNVSLTQRLHAAETARDSAPSTPMSMTDRVTHQITGREPETPAQQAGATIRTPAGDLTGLDLGDTSDLADQDTGLLGERYFVVTLDARVAAARRHLRPLALVLLEAVTDASATASPVDATLAADVVRETLRDADTLCRLHGGQFAILLEDTPENGAIWTVERIRRRLGEHLDDATVWAGIACYPANGFDGPEVLDRAREALNQAREWRQDRTEVADS